VPERRRVDVAQLAEREGLRREREADVRVRELCAKAVAADERDLPMVECQPRQPIDRVPVRVFGQGGVDAERNDAEVGGRELALTRVTGRLTQRPELLEV
jgi:hypothetical protein